MDNLPLFSWASEEPQQECEENVAELDFQLLGRLRQLMPLVVLQAPNAYLINASSGDQVKRLVEREYGKQITTVTPEQIPPNPARGARGLICWESAGPAAPPSRVIEVSKLKSLRGVDALLLWWSVHDTTPVSTLLRRVERRVWWMTRAPQEAGWALALGTNSARFEGLDRAIFNRIEDTPPALPRNPARRKSRRLREMGVTTAERFNVFRRDGFQCRVCGRTADDGVKLEIDHILPRARGGGNEEENLWTLCFDCNNGKGVKGLNRGAA